MLLHVRGSGEKLDRGGVALISQLYWTSTEFDSIRVINEYACTSARRLHSFIKELIGYDPDGGIVGVLISDPRNYWLFFVSKTDTKSGCRIRAPGRGSEPDYSMVYGLVRPEDFQQYIAQSPVSKSFKACSNDLFMFECNGIVSNELALDKGFMEYLCDEKPPYLYGVCLSLESGNIDVLGASKHWSSIVGVERISVDKRLVGSLSTFLSLVGNIGEAIASRVKCLEGMGAGYAVENVVLVFRLEAGDNAGSVDDVVKAITGRFNRLVSERIKCRGDFKSLAEAFRATLQGDKDSRVSRVASVFEDVLGGGSSDGSTGNGDVDRCIGELQGLLPCLLYHWLTKGYSDSVVAYLRRLLRDLARNSPVWELLGVSRDSLVLDDGLARLYCALSNAGLRDSVLAKSIVENVRVDVRRLLGASVGGKCLRLIVNRLLEGKRLSADNIVKEYYRVLEEDAEMHCGRKQGRVNEQAGLETYARNIAVLADVVAKSSSFESRLLQAITRGGESGIGEGSDLEKTLSRVSKKSVVWLLLLLHLADTYAVRGSLKEVARLAAYARYWSGRNVREMGCYAERVLEHYKLLRRGGEE